MKRPITGKELRILRSLKNIKAVEVADAIGRTPAVITHIESGVRRLTLLETDRIRTAFNISDDVLKSVRQLITLSNKGG